MRVTITLKPEVRYVAFNALVARGLKQNNERGQWFGPVFENVREISTEEYPGFLTIVGENELPDYSYSLGDIARIKTDYV